MSGCGSRRSRDSGQGVCPGGWTRLVCTPDLAFTAPCWSPLAPALTHLCPAQRGSQRGSRLPPRHAVFLPGLQEGHGHSAVPAPPPAPPCPAGRPASARAPSLLEVSSRLRFFVTHEFALEWRCLSFAASGVQAHEAERVVSPHGQREDCGKGRTAAERRAGCVLGCREGQSPLLCRRGGRGPSSAATPAEQSPWEDI